MDLKNAPALLNFQDDMLEHEKEALALFKADGCPGVSGIKQSDVIRWFKLYMIGKTYEEISKQTQVSKTFILYISEKNKWHEQKIEYYGNLSKNVFQQTTQVKIEGIKVVSDIISALSQYFGTKCLNYLITNNELEIQQLDGKLLSQFYKALEVLDKITESTATSDKAPKSPLVNISLGDNSEITQTDENSLKVTKDNSASSLLKLLHQMKKDADKENKD